MKTQIVSFLVFLKCLNLLKTCFVNIHANWSHAVKSPRFRTTPISLPTIAFRSASIIRPSEWHSALAQCDQLENCENNIISCCSYCCGTKRSCVLVCVNRLVLHWCSHWCAYCDDVEKWFGRCWPNTWPNTLDKLPPCPFPSIIRRTSNAPPNHLNRLRELPVCH